MCCSRQILAGRYLFVERLVGQTWRCTVLVGTSEQVTQHVVAGFAIQELWHELQTGASMGRWLGAQVLERGRILCVSSRPNLPLKEQVAAHSHMSIEKNTLLQMLSHNGLSSLHHGRYPDVPRACLASLQGWTGVSGTTVPDTNTLQILLPENLRFLLLDRFWFAAIASSAERPCFFCMALEHLLRTAVDVVFGAFFNRKANS